MNEQETFQTGFEEISTFEPKELLKMMLTMYKELGIEIVQEVEMSEELLTLQLHSGLAQELKAAINDPLNANYQGYKLFKNNVTSLIDLLIINYLKTKTGVVSNVFKLCTDTNLLHYSVIMKKDDLKSNVELYKINDRYNQSEYSKSFVMVIQPIPIDLSDSFLNTEFNIANKYIKLL